MTSPQTISHARETIAGFLRSRREALGLSQVQLAEQAGLGIRTVQRIEAAAFIPDGKSLVKLCAALSIKLILESPGKAVQVN